MKNLVIKYMLVPCFGYASLSMSIEPMKLDHKDIVVSFTKEAWKISYKGMIDDDYLDNFPEKSFLAGREFILSKKEFSSLIVLDDKRSIMGFSDAGRKRDEENNTDEAEVYALYVDSKIQGQGVGKALLDAQFEFLKGKNYSSVIIWTLEKNERARIFYEKYGGALSEKAFKNIGGKDYPSVMYRWSLNP